MRLFSWLVLLGCALAFAGCKPPRTIATDPKSGFILSRSDVYIDTPHELIETVDRRGDIIVQTNLLHGSRKRPTPVKFHRYVQVPDAVPNPKISTAILYESLGGVIRKLGMPVGQLAVWRTVRSRNLYIGETLVFRHENWDVYATFVGSVCLEVSYMKSNHTSLSEIDVRTLISLNRADVSTWVEGKAGNSDIWNDTVDGSRVVLKHTVPETLTFETKELADAISAAAN